MRRTDQWSGLAVLIAGLLIWWGASAMPYGTIHEPGPGFFPFWLGILLTGMSLWLIIRESRGKASSAMIRDLLSEKIRWGKVLAALAALVAYGVLMEHVGFIIVTFLFLAFLLWFVDPQPWKKVIGWALCGSVGCYLIFEVWLKLRLPAGLLRI